ncbi:outer membrane beta-barrel protein [Taibaiella koreensis]|uniref:outer membrane beta-barrel protein n=1 Tax=Taibaiella koreensis TaxID=1268548 RepID=UPI000E59F412|nr:outer membrane beta-barrel protein [Taibaiella koreensis]
MSKIYLLLCSLLCFCSYKLSAQQAPVSIRLSDGKQPVSFAAITVIGQVDTQYRRSAIADTGGVALFDLDTPGLYLVQVTALNYKSLSKGIHARTGATDFNLLLEATGSAIGEVTIKAVKTPLIRQEDDKTIVDPSSLAEASTSGYEVLEKTPGIFIDQDGNIYLGSITPATVYINGREMKMSRTDIATMLKSLPPNAIEKIEILRTPSAKYDASGAGGIVNVVLKKGVKIGLTGSINAGFQQGTYGNQFGGVNIANSNGITSTYLNLNYTRRNGYDVLNTQRHIGGDSLLGQASRTTSPGNVYFLGYGISHEWNNKWSTAYDGTVSYTDAFNKTENTNIFSRETQVLGESVAHLKNDDGTFFINQDVSSTYKIDSAGSQWTNDLSYLYSANSIDQVFGSQSPLAYDGDGTVSGKRHFLAFQSDLVYKLRYRISLEAGLKGSYLNFDNDAAYFLTYNGDRIPDNTRTSVYRYRENINAAYLQASKALSDIILKAGVRMENTNMDGQQRVPGDTSFTIRRTDFFPYVYLSKRLMSIAHFEIRAYLVYRRTISRPTYEQLNPFPQYVDQFLSEAGNPTLKPQFTNNYEFNISAAEHPLLAIGFNDTRDMFTNVYYQGDNGSKAQAFRTYDNIGRNREFYLRGFGAIPPGGIYFFVLGGQYNYNIYEGFYEGKPLSFRRPSWLFFTYHQLKLDKNSQITMNGFLRLKGPLQFYELSTFGALNISINRKFFKQKLTVTLSANDIFFTNNNNFTIEQGTVDASGYRETDSRRFGINLRYNFGFHKKEEERDMFTAPERTN